LGHVGAAHEIDISLNLKDKLYQMHGIGGVFQRPAKPAAARSLFNAGVDSGIFDMQTF